jgi:hypothetical protein
MTMPRIWWPSVHHVIKKPIISADRWPRGPSRDTKAGNARHIPLEAEPGETVTPTRGLAAIGIELRYCPVPDKNTVCGVLLASSFTTTLAVLVPTSLGVKVTAIVQLPPPANVPVEQVFVGAKKAKLLALVPMIAMLEIVCGTLSLLVRTVVITALVVPWFWAAKSRLLGDTLIGATVGTTPAPGLK